MYVKLTIAAIAAGFVIDCFLGDPARFPHPVILIGKAISFLEKALRKIHKLGIHQRCPFTSYILCFF